MSRASLVEAFFLFAFLCLGVDGAVAQTIHPPTIVAVCTPCHGADGAGGDVMCRISPARRASIFANNSSPSARAAASIRK